jgi:hypothetical protein
MTRSVPICVTPVTRLLLRYFRRRLTNTEGAVAAVREKDVRWQRKPESISSCSRLPGLANLMRNIRLERS